MDIHLGKVFHSKLEKRDAIHVAVVSVSAGEQDLKPGDHVGFLENGKVGKSAEKLIGIIDPFIKDIQNFQANLKYNHPNFFLLLYPGTTLALSHHWIHPEFNKEESVKWIENFASLLNTSYDDLMAVARIWVKQGTWSYDNSERYKDYYDDFPTFWDHFEVVTGLFCDDKGCPYTCSC